MSNILSFDSHSKIYWPQVIALLILDICVIISWIAYHEFQPSIIESFGLTDFAFEFTIWSFLIIVITPGIAGLVADNISQKTGKRLPVINVGVNVAAMIFMAVALTLFFEPSGPIKWLIPVFITFWLISMNMFRSPAISIIERLVPQRQLPAVLALFIFTFDIAYSVEPIIVDVLTFLGGPITFLVGGIMIFASGTYLKASYKKVAHLKLDKNAYENDTKTGKSKFWIVITLSLVLGVYTTLMLKFIPNFLNDRMGYLDLNISGSVLATLMLFTSAIICFFLGKKVNKDNIDVFAVWGILGFALSIGLLVAFSSLFATLACALMLMIFFSFLSVSALPLALYELSSKQTIFGIGLFYGFAEFGDQLWNVIFF